MSQLPELWGGIEATVNRVGDEFFDQVKISGHDSRLDDIARIAEAGIKAFRYPVLWEKHAATPVDWGFSDEPLNAIRSFGIKPIAGLCHHGSGPAHTNLLEPTFVSG